MNEFELEPGETIGLSVRSHWIVLLSRLFPSILLAFVPFLFPVLISSAARMNPQTGSALLTGLSAASPWLTLLLAFWWLFIWMSIVATLTRYYLTIWIITTTRIVDIRQYGFFSRQVSSFLLSRIQDVTSDVDGFFETMFGFGKLNVETAGREEKFQMSGIQHPVEIRDLIMREIAALHKTEGSSETGI